MAVDFLVNPNHLYERATKIEGWYFLDSIPMFYKMVTANEITDLWAADWDEDEGFGSSDFTYMIQDYLDTLISNLPFKTTFNPYLQIVKKPI